MINSLRQVKKKREAELYHSSQEYLHLKKDYEERITLGPKKNISNGKVLILVMLFYPIGKESSGETKKRKHDG